MMVKSQTDFSCEILKRGERKKILSRKKMTRMNKEVRKLNYNREHITAAKVQDQRELNQVSTRIM